MKITVTEEQRRAVEVEVTFPLFRYLDAGGDDYVAEHWTKIEMTPTGPVAYTLHSTFSHHRPGETWSATVEPFRPRADTADYVLGRGQYALTSEAWAHARARFEAWLRASGLLKS